MSLFLKPFEFVLNKALAQDPETKEKLEQFDGRRIAINVSDIELTILAVFDQQKIQLSTSDNNESDLSITGTSFDLLKVGSEPDTLFSAAIEIHGNVQFAKQLRDILDGFDFDWEQQLAKITGDTLAYPLAEGLRNFASWAKNSHASMQQNISEYLREEAQILPDQSQIKTYLSDVDTLRADCDRLIARIERLENNK
jgi:ubiquinone biosynthesis accessory factor UbiJ